MSYITSEIAKKHLDEWLEAELAVTTGQAYQIGSRKMERANLYQIRENIKYWESKYNEAIARETGKSSRRRIIGVIPRDL